MPFVEPSTTITTVLWGLVALLGLTWQSPTNVESRQPTWTPVPALFSQKFPPSGFVGFRFSGRTLRGALGALRDHVPSERAKLFGPQTTSGKALVGRTSARRKKQRWVQLASCTSTGRAFDFFILFWPIQYAIDVFQLTGWNLDLQEFPSVVSSLSGRPLRGGLFFGWAGRYDQWETWFFVFGPGFEGTGHCQSGRDRWPVYSPSFALALKHRNQLRGIIYSHEGV